MEPRYVADNGYIDAFAMAWLFQEDHLFFRDDEIIWDGKRHGIRGMQNNAATINEIPFFVSNMEGMLPGVVDFLVKLEEQDNLCVPRESIHKALYPAIREGNLTGLTLFNLLACAKAMTLKRQDENSYVVIYDTNLAKGIPHFSELVGNLITFMREYNEIVGDFTVVFMGSRNVDFAEAFLAGDLNAVPSSVAGAKLEPLLKLTSGNGRVCTNSAGEAVDTKPVAPEPSHDKKPLNPPNSKEAGLSAEPKPKPDGMSSGSQIDGDLADKVAWALIFDGGLRTAKWISEMVPGVDKSAKAKPLLAYLASKGVLDDSGNGRYKAIVDFEAYTNLILDDAVRKLDREQYYDVLLSVLLDYGDYAKLDELLTSVEGLPKRSIVRALLLAGVEKGDLEQKGRNLSFKCAMDDERVAAWRKDSESRRKVREKKQKALALRREAVKTGAEYKSALKQYRKWVDGKKAADAAAAVKALEAQQAADQADIRLIVDKLEGYRLGNGFVDAKWAKEAVRDVKTIKRAQELLDKAWESGFIRRASKDNGWIFAKLIPADEWAELRESLNKKLALEFAEKDERLKAEFERQCERRRRNAQAAVAAAESAEQTVRGAASYALEKVEKTESELAAACSRAKAVDDKAVASAHEMSGLKAELDAAGLFAFGRKSELKQKIIAAQVHMDKLGVDKRRAEAAVATAEKQLDKAKARLARLQKDVAKAEDTASVCRKAASVLEAELAKGYEPAKPAIEDMLSRMAQIAQAWSAPVSAQWIAENVDGVDTAAEAQKLLVSAQGKVAFVLRETGLYQPTGNFAGDAAVANHDKRSKAVAKTKLKPGQMVCFGSFAIDGQGEAAMLRWHILDVDVARGEALLLCDSSLGDAPFNKGKRTGTWATCSLAKWLSETFIDQAFSAAERKALVQRKGLRDAFALSKDEFVNYKKKPGITPIEAAYRAGSYGENRWWLRTSTDDTHTRAMYVTDKNCLSKKGVSVYVREGFGVRPAMWVDALSVESCVIC